MRLTSMAMVGTMFAVVFCFSNPVMHADQNSNAQQGQQGQQAPQGAPKPPTASIALRKFVFTLALGDVQAGPGSTFTPAASKALADLKDFLPYKRYSLLDTIYKIGLVGPSVQMKGVDDVQKYELWTSGVAHPDGRRISVKLQLRTVAAPPAQVTFLIETSFEIDMGETVVVGTSRLDGNRALLLLVTSVP
jgi:hypothetical protein